MLAAAFVFLGHVFPVAAEPVAIVEEVSSPGAGIQFMDFVDKGQVIRLGAKDELILGYLPSCLRETITGGTVTIGPQKSTVSGGKVTRERVECDGGNMQLTEAQTKKSAVMVFRKAMSSGIPEPAYTIYGTAPVVLVPPGATEIVIERLDMPADVLRFETSGRIVDLAKLGKTLKPRGLYRARSGNKNVVIKVDAYARPGAVPLIGRLIKF
jgi:hypothetical protein